MMAHFVISAIAITMLMWAFKRLRIRQVAQHVISAAHDGIASMMDAELNDHAKEIAVRRAGFQILKCTANIFGRSLIAISAAGMPLLLADAIQITPMKETLRTMIRVDSMVYLSIFALILAMIDRRYFHKKEEQTEEPKHRYSNGDKILHYLAFSSPIVLKASAWTEEKLFPADEQDQAHPPLFITSLARGGTTALLNAFHAMPMTATHLYRDMPFITAPILWHRLSGGSKRTVKRQERFHGDGLDMHLDAPEAFEEVIWKMHWPEKYGQRGIALWDEEDQQKQAEIFLQQHMAQIVHARRHLQHHGEEPLFYCSKNNSHIARLPFLRHRFPRCHIVIPIRRPECHAASLLRQHKNFLKRQEQDPFIRRYMRDIGHFEFGLEHRPFFFPGFDPDAYPPTTANYWLSYWIHAFRYVLEHCDHCHLVFQDDLRARPQATMEQLLSQLSHPPTALDYRSFFHAHPDTSDTAPYDPALYAQAAEIYQALK
jgi:hypothetical protein